MADIVTKQALQGAVGEIAREIKKDRGKVGLEDGIAPLNTYGMVPLEHLPFPLLFISGTISTDDDRILEESERLPYVADSTDVQLWRTSGAVRNQKIYPGFVVTTDGVTFYRSWDWQHDSGIPASEELAVCYANCLFLLGNILCRRVSNAYRPLLDLETLLKSKADISSEGVITANKFKLEGGSRYQFLKADGSLDQTEYIPVENGFSAWQTLIAPVFLDEEGRQMQMPETVVIDLGDNGMADGTQLPLSNEREELYKYMENMLIYKIPFHVLIRYGFCSFIPTLVHYKGTSEIVMEGRSSNYGHIYTLSSVGTLAYKRV